MLRTEIIDKCHVDRTANILRYKEKSLRFNPGEIIQIDTPRYSIQEYPFEGEEGKICSGAEFIIPPNSSTRIMKFTTDAIVNQILIEGEGSCLIADPDEKLITIYHIKKNEKESRQIEIGGKGRMYSWINPKCQLQDLHVIDITEPPFNENMETIVPFPNLKELREYGRNSFLGRFWNTYYAIKSGNVLPEGIESIEV